jgi:phosphoribosylanthranilate isomerase
MGGDVKAAELFFKVCGLIRKPTDDAAIAETAKALLDGMIAEARARRQP